MSRRKTSGSHIELSPHGKRRVARTLRRQEAAWARRSGAVRVRNVLDDENKILDAALMVEGPFGACDLETITTEVQKHDPTLDRSTIERIIVKRLARAPESPFAIKGNGSYRFRRYVLQSARPVSPTEENLQRVRMEFVKPWE